MKPEISDWLKQTEIIELVKKFKDKLNNINLNEIILFGSYAKNSQHENSDIDLIIVSDDFKGKKSFKRANDLYLNWDEDVSVDFICLTNEELENKRNQIGIISQALKEGIIIK